MSTSVDTTAEASPPRQHLSRRQLRNEILLVLGVSLGASAISSIINIIQTATGPGLSHATATLNPSLAPGRPWIDLVKNLYNIFFGLVPAFLAWHLLARDHDNVPRLLGVDATRPRRDALTGVGLAALIGIPGLGLYWAARTIGINATVQASALEKVWWAIPVLVLSAIQNGIYEEVIVVGYLTTRLEQLGVRLVPMILASATLRGSYHLYQGFGGFIGNFVMGIVFAYMYRWYGRVMPLIIAHSILDTVSFVGYALLAPYWSFLR